ncbi:DnaJ-domain-containing protein [Pseudovirgaria hyperparasitica]|uniref:DnaJ-domain-containing protein n=1 Tax=Pseudovirgaria hyperparasitica TaxID=470096 RepID=A0A6A6WK73_9PEZI|nr:DnaJ-domain-containing protein [Pseudovirgaria hyperparasitica]KAF2762567.1 DnaJ-domain-containing protein [Pseudovirgaria hyperparasitica]
MRDFMSQWSPRLFVTRLWRGIPPNMSTEDLKQHATSTHDFYELLGVSYETSEADIKRAYRKTSLKYHPDKNPGNLNIVEKFHLIGIARDVLLNPEAKALHDKTRIARIQKQRQNDLLEGKRRTMKEDLERRESGFKRKRAEEEDELEQQERDLRRLAEEGRRKRMQMEHDRKKRDEEDASIIEQPPNTHTPQQAQAPEIERRIFVRFLREGAGLTYEEKSITDMFSRFGRIEHAFVLREKKTRLAGEKHKKLVATAAITFGSAFSALSALEDGKALSELFVDISAGNVARTELGAAPSTPIGSPALNRSFRSSMGSVGGVVSTTTCEAELPVRRFSSLPPPV